MTAIAGVWHTDGRPSASHDLTQMLAAQRMYGPDAGDAWSAENIGLGRRLSRVLPEDAFDEQPLRCAIGRYRLVADLRLDNRSELASLLGIQDESNKSDAAILLAAWERWADACLDRLVGDYAFAVWDASGARLLLVRDPLGCRPLHYFRDSNFFAFASMPKGLHALPEVPYEADEEFFAEGLLYYLEDGTRSFFRDIHKVPAGHLVIVDRDGLTVRRHWHPARQLLKLSRATDYDEALREKLEVAVRCRLRGTHAVATHLSGGLDSSAVTATAARLAPGERVFAFTSVPRVGFSGSDPQNRFTDEGSHAAAVAALYPNIEHVRLPTPAVSAIDGLDRAFDLYETPLVNLCNQTWIDAINDAVRDRGLGVMLVGSMGNFTASYSGGELFAELLRTGRWPRLAREMSILIRKRPQDWKRLLFLTLGPFLPLSIWMHLSRHRSMSAAYFPLSNPARHAEVHERMPLTRSVHALNRPSADSIASRLRGLCIADPANYHKGILAHWRVDYRDPFTDRRLVEFCLSVPIEYFCGGGVSRRLARSAFADRLPSVIVDETRKGLQAADWHMGIMASEQLLADEVSQIAASAVARRLLDVHALQRTALELPVKDWDTEQNTARFRIGMLRTISAGHFLRRVDSPRSPASE